MQFLTPRKRAEGMGAAHHGTHHHWQMQVTGMALAILAPFFLFTFGRILGAPYEEVVAYYSRPVPAVVAGLTLVVGLLHFAAGAQMAIEDYSGGMTRKILVVAANFVAYAAAAFAIFALVRLAL